MEGARHQRPGDARPGEGREVVRSSHAARSVKRGRSALPCRTAGGALQGRHVRPLSATDAGESHDNDALRPQAGIAVRPLRPARAGGVVVEGENHALRPKGGLHIGVPKAFGADDGGAEAIFRTGGDMDRIALTRIHPQFEAREGASEVAYRCVIAARPGYGIDISHIEGAERCKREQPGNHVVRLGGGRERSLDGAIGLALAPVGTHDDPSLQVDDGDKLHDEIGPSLYARSPMRVFICEYVTSGGMRDKPLPEAALAEGRLIRDAIVTDLQELVGINVVLAYDDRLPPPTEEAVPVGKGVDPWIIWSSLAQDADVVWPIAPEAGGLLARLARLMREGGARTLASSSEAIVLTSNRLALARRLAEHDIPHVPTFPIDALPAGLDGDLVTRPEEGTGWSAARAWPNRAALPRSGSLVVQPFLNGTLASLSVLVRSDGVTLLAANRLSISHFVGVFAFEGVQVGGISDEDGRLADIARRVAKAIPGLSGIVCIDVILTPQGPVVAEVNPRITASYAGLHAALGVNPLAFVPELIREGVPPSMPRLPRPAPIEVKIR